MEGFLRKQHYQQSAAESGARMRKARHLGSRNSRTDILQLGMRHSKLWNKPGAAAEACSNSLIETQKIESVDLAHQDVQSCPALSTKAARRCGTWDGLRRRGSLIDDSSESVPLAWTLGLPAPLQKWLQTPTVAGVR